MFLREDIKNNRDKILEINQFLDIQREDFAKLTAIPVGPRINAELSAALDKIVY